MPRRSLVVGIGLIHNTAKYVQGGVGAPALAAKAAERAEGAFRNVGLVRVGVVHPEDPHGHADGFQLILEVPRVVLKQGLGVDAGEVRQVAGVELRQGPVKVHWPLSRGVGPELGPPKLYGGAAQRGRFERKGRRSPELPGRVPEGSGINPGADDCCVPAPAKLLSFPRAMQL